MKPRLLDLFCGQGGSARGYAEAGFEVVGVDAHPQPRYPYEFHQADATTYPLEGFDVLTGSPPCQDHSALSSRSGLHHTGWMLEHTLARFEAAGLPYVVENVVGAPLAGALILCGTEFDLKAEGRWLKRHRMFASNMLLMGAGGCSCAGRPIGGVYGHGGGRSIRGYSFRLAARCQAMGIDWMTMAGLSQAIPPAYTRFIGEQIMDHLGAMP